MNSGFSNVGFANLNPASPGNKNIALVIGNMTKLYRFANEVKDFYCVSLQLNLFLRSWFFEVYYYCNVTKHFGCLKWAIVGLFEPSKQVDKIKLQKDFQIEYLIMEKLPIHMWTGLKFHKMDKPRIQ